MISPTIYFNAVPKTVLDDFVREVRGTGLLALDTETNGLDPYKNDLLLIQVAVPSGLTLVYSESLPRAIFELLKDPTITVVGHNLAFDIRFMWRTFGKETLPFENIYDAMIAEAVLTMGQGLRVSLAAIALRRLRVNLDKSIRFSFIGMAKGTPFTDSQIKYSAEDVFYLFEIMRQQQAEAKEKALDRVLALENDTVTTTALLMYNGIGFDAARWESLLEKEEQRVLAILVDLYEMWPADKKQPVRVPFFAGIVEQMDAHIRAMNVNNPATVLGVLKGQYGSGLETTDKFALEDLVDRDPLREAGLAAKILEFRTHSKRLTAFLRPLLNEVSPITGRMHFEYTQLATWLAAVSAGASTGRYSCKRGHQIPAEHDFRAPFRAPGKVTITADYSGVELRIAGNLSREEVLIQFFNDPNLTDYHGYMASRVFNVPLEDVVKMVIDGEETNPTRPDLRAKAKTTNFSMLYLVSKFGLSKRLKVSEDEAEAILNDFNKTLARLMPTVNGYGDEAVRRRYIRDQTLGRIRYFSRKEEDYKVKRQGANMPIQGTSANQLKLAMNKLRRRLPQGADLVGTVHDEIIVECLPEQAESVAKLIEETMLEAANEILPGPIPYEVGVAVAESWTK